MAITAEGVILEMQAKTDAFDKAIERTVGKFDRNFARMGATLARQAKEFGVFGKEAGAALEFFASNIASVHTPIQAIGIALAGLGVLMYEIWKSSGEEVKDLDTLWKEYDKTLGKVEQSYKGVRAAIGNARQQPAAVLELELWQKQIEFARKFRDEHAAVMAQLKEGTFGLDRIFNIDPSASQEWGVFNGIVRSFFDDLKAGRGDVERFRQQVALMAQNHPTVKSVQDMARALLEMTSAMDESQRGTAVTAEAIRQLGLVASGELERIKAFESALKKLQGIAVKPLSPRELVDKTFEEALAASGSGSAGAAAAEAAIAARVDALKRIDAAEAEAEAKRKSREAARASRRGASASDSFERTLLDREKQIKLLELEAAAVGRSAVEHDRLRVVTELEAAAIRQGLALTPERTARINEVAEAYANAAHNARATQEAWRGAVTLQTELGNMFIDGIMGAIDGTKRFDEVLKDTIKTLGRMALQAALLGQGPLAGLFSTQPGAQGGVGGILGSLASGLLGGPQVGIGQPGYAGGLNLAPRALGGPVTAGKPYLVGERGPEMMIPKTNGIVVPNRALTGGTSRTEVNIINNSGAGVETRRRSNGTTDVLDVMIAAVNGGMKSGQFDSAMGSRYGASPVARNR